MENENSSKDGRGPVEEMELEELRAEIESVDRELVELINRRTEIAKTVAAVKEAKGISLNDEDQIARVVERAGENAEEFGLDVNLVKTIFRLLIQLNMVVEYQRKIDMLSEE